MSLCSCENGTLCSPCGVQLTSDLEIIAGVNGWEGSDLLSELNITITRQNVTPGMQITATVKSDEQPILFHLHASDARQLLERTMRTVRFDVTTHYPHLNAVNSDPKTVARWLLLVPQLLHEHPDILTIAAQIRLAVYEALRVIDAPATRALLGFCPQCSRALYVIMESDDTFDDRLVKCCGEPQTVRNLRARLRDKLQNTFVTPAESVGLVHAFTGQAVTEGAVRKRAKRAGLQGYPRYSAWALVNLFVTEDTSRGY